MLRRSTLKCYYRTQTTDGGIMDDDEPKAPDRSLVDRLIVIPDEELSDEELKSRWKFQQPSMNFYFVSFASLIGALSVLISHGSVLLSICLLVAAVVIPIAIYYSQEIGASRRTREQLIADIKFLREMHSDMDM